ncbi:hypothetical protein JMJ35_008213 [Cladonia borealis]|uniref:Uncharacterized protein n=1 Tax=Cladonia borealis TaxID=184061 RepID=A0AA39V3E8_9LECA|nr:hypothetical protein JMJ35_008213 [Cladonia borealis]
MFPFLGISIIAFSVASSGLVQRGAQISNIRIFPVSFNQPSPAASTLLPENTPPSASLSALPTSSFNVSSKNINVLNTTEADLRCDREGGQGLTVESCVQAQSQLKTWLNGKPRYYITIGQPGYGVWDVNDRITFLSSDRVCAFDFWVTWGDEDHKVATSDLAHASNELMLHCVTPAGGPAAGSYGYIGFDENVEMEVRYQQRFSNLECSSAPPAGPSIASCFALRNSMPKAGDEQTFGRNGAEVDVVLPYTLVGGIVIPVPHYFSNPTADDGADDSATWYEMYMAATEIEASCVRRGLRGMINGLGEDGNLLVMLSNPGRLSPGLATNNSMNYTSSF